ncbi:MAG: phospho-sugar mutase [Firmicutes bacterium]|nr:phospho-sugar mutase [Bacillota bacterium]
MSTGKYETVLKQCKLWMDNSKLDPAMRAELEVYTKALDQNPEDAAALDEIYERFYKELEFGTGGLRGILGAGTNRMNVHTVAKATQGLANYVNNHYAVKKTLFKKGKKASVAISYDSRNMSKEFANMCARVLVANDIEVYLYKELMPTPALSFAVRHYGCAAGIMITASHNPAKYNGYKAYNDEGCQMSGEQADEVLGEINKLDIFRDVKMAADDSAVNYIPEETIDAYIAAVKKESTGFNGCKNLEVVYTPLNGAGNKPVRRILDEIGVGKVIIVPEQELPDGNFPTAPYPNPEKKEALKLGLDLCKELGTPDLLLATDPDADRVGIAVKHDGEFVLLTGNEVGVLLLDFLCQVEKLAENPICVKTIVSSKMTDAVAKNYGVEVKNVLTGFKYIGEQIKLLEEKGEEDRYVLGFEESYGYLSGPYVRDKDAVNASMLICEMASFYKSAGTDLVAHLNDLYDKYGYYKNDLMDINFEGAAGMEKMASIIEGLRQNPLTSVNGHAVVSKIDYGKDDTGLPKSTVLEYNMEDGSTVIVRPSGTEPKLKIYLSARGTSVADSERIIAAMKEEMGALVK